MKLVLFATCAFLFLQSTAYASEAPIECQNYRDGDVRLALICVNALHEQEQIRETAIGLAGGVGGGVGLFAGGIAAGASGWVFPQGVTMSWNMIGSGLVKLSVGMAGGAALGVALLGGAVYVFWPRQPDDTIAAMYNSQDGLVEFLKLDAIDQTQFIHDYNPTKLMSALCAIAAASRDGRPQLIKP